MALGAINTPVTAAAKPATANTAAAKAATPVATPAAPPPIDWTQVMAQRRSDAYAEITQLAETPPPEPPVYVSANYDGSDGSSSDKGSDKPPDKPSAAIEAFPDKSSLFGGSDSSSTSK